MKFWPLSVFNQIYPFQKTGPTIFSFSIAFIRIFLMRSRLSCRMVTSALWGPKKFVNSNVWAPHMVEHVGKPIGNAMATVGWAYNESMTRHWSWSNIFSQGLRLYISFWNYNTKLLHPMCLWYLINLDKGKFYYFDLIDHWFLLFYIDNPFMLIVKFEVIVVVLIFKRILGFHGFVRIENNLRGGELDWLEN